MLINKNVSFTTFFYEKKIFFCRISKIIYKHLINPMYYLVLNALPPMLPQIPNFEKNSKIAKSCNLQCTLSIFIAS